MSRPFRFGVVSGMARSGEAWAEEARSVEALGYGALLVPGRIGPLLSPMPALTAAAAATRTLRVGTFVLAAGWRNPALLGQECATLDILSDGRFELGPGAGIGREDAERAELPVSSPGALMRCGVGDGAVDRYYRTKTGKRGVVCYYRCREGNRRKETCPNNRSIRSDMAHPRSSSVDTLSATKGGRPGRTGAGHARGHESCLGRFPNWHR
jgi:hypothetical protein